MNDRSKGKPDYTKFMKKPASLDLDPPAEPILPPPAKTSPEIPGAEIIALTESEESDPNLSLKMFEVVDVSPSGTPSSGAFAAHVKQLGPAPSSPNPKAPEKKASPSRLPISVDDLEIPGSQVIEQPLPQRQFTILEPPPAPVMLFGLIVLLLAVSF